jgi:hypothetical protein
MASPPLPTTIESMGATYAVTWRDSEGATDSGRLEFGPHALRLEGSRILEIAYEDVADVSIGRGTGDRLGGRTTVLVARRSGRPLWIAPVIHHTALLEVFDRLSLLASAQ